MRKKNILLVAVCILLISVSIFVNRGREISGSDDAAIETIGEIAKDYKPWVNSVWEPQSGIAENLLFVLQGAIGVSIIGFYVRYKVKCSDKSQLSQK
jgi:cobalt/nickel transport protein